MTQSKRLGQGPELEAVALLGESSSDPYVISLAALSLFNVADSKRATALTKRLVAMQDEVGIRFFFSFTLAIRPSAATANFFRF